MKLEEYRRLVEEVRAQTQNRNDDFCICLEQDSMVEFRKEIGQTEPILVTSFEYDGRKIKLLQRF